MSLTRLRRHVPLLLVILLPLFLTRMCQAWGPQYIEPERVLEEARKLGERYDIDPGFIYAVAFAESSFNASASTARARGLMQMTRPAWVRTSRRPFHQAWDWRLNMRYAVAYMAALRWELEEAGQFSYPNLAAAYHFGFTRLGKHGYDVTKLPATNNRVYQALLAGRQPAEFLPKAPVVEIAAFVVAEPPPPPAGEPPPPEQAPPAEPPDAAANEAVLFTEAPEPAPLPGEPPAEAVDPSPPAETAREVEAVQ